MGWPSTSLQTWTTSVTSNPAACRYALALYVQRRPTRESRVLGCALSAAFDVDGQLPLPERSGNISCARVRQPIGHPGRSRYGRETSSVALAQSTVLPGIVVRPSRTRPQGAHAAARSPRGARPRVRNTIVRPRWSTALHCDGHEVA
eukprot:scaffold439_cov415-Prasinococcus_capsulatus_cf.AAC.18